MLDKSLREKILNLMHREVVPATGCTEPVAVALCVARASEALGSLPSHISVNLSANILKNAMGVGIPGTGMIGLPIAIALGALIGRSEYELQVLKDVNDEAVSRGRKMIGEGAIDISLKTDISEKLYVEANVCDASGNVAVAIISGGHSRFVKVTRNDETLFSIDENANSDASADSGVPELDLRTVYEFATTSPLDELTFILEARRLNKSIAEQAFMGDYGHCVGKTLQSRRERSIMGDCIMSRIMSYTTSACDARMSGAPIPVMSNSGSGNQGIATTLPVVIFAEEIFASEEKTIRALILSHLTAIYIKQSLGKLSAHCGCVVAATGSANGICYLMGGEYEQVAATTKNMIANLTGMICDGAKPACSLKIASGVSTAIMSAIIAMEGHCVTPLEGIIDESVDQSIKNLTHIGHDAMNETDITILDIMTGKK